MEKVYECKKQYGSYAIPFVEQEGLLDKLSQMFGKNITDWNYVNIYWDKEEGEQITDFTFILGYIPLCSQKVYEILMKQENLENIQFLPINIERSKYYIINPCEIIENALNKRKSKIKYFPNGEIMWISKYVFTQITPKSLLFKIPEMTTTLFATQSVIDLVKNNSLTGIEFVECQIEDRNWIDKILGYK